MTFHDILSSLEDYTRSNQDGNGNPLVALAELRAIAKAADAAAKAMDALAQREAEKYPKEFELAGFKFTKSEGRAMFDYSGITEWVKLKNKMKEVEEKAKTAAQIALKGNMVVSEDGEVSERAVITYTKSSLTIK